MKTKTKLIALLLCVALLAVTASGCASFTRLKDKLAPDDYSVYTKSDDDDDDSASEYDVDIDVPKDYKSSSSSSGSDITIEEQVLFDKAGIKITALEYEASDEYGDEMTILVENTSDIDVTISTEVVVIDGFVTSNASFYTNVSAGKKVYDPMYLFLNEYERKCIGDVGKIELYLNCYDEGYDTIFENEYMQIRTSAYEEKDAEMTISNTELVNKNGVKVGFMGVTEEEYTESKYVYFYIENNTDSGVTVTSNDVVINGVKSDGLLYERLPAGTKSISYMILFKSELEENNIKSIEEIELKLEAYDSKNFDNVFETDTITIKAN